MKKNLTVILISSFVISLTAFGIISENGLVKDSNDCHVADGENIEVDIPEKVEDPFFWIGTRFNSITKSKLNQLRTFNEYIGEEHANRIVKFNSLAVILLENGEQTFTKKKTDGGVFSQEQLELIQSFDYSTDILLWADYMENDKKTGKYQKAVWTPYLTIVPEHQAFYLDGEAALLRYFEQNSIEEKANILEGKLESGRLHFTVSNAGKISSAKIISTSGDTVFDKKIVELMNTLPGKWQPAKKLNGETVDQTLVLSIGKRGC